MRSAILFVWPAMLLGACASIVSDNDSTTYIETDPETARCELHGQDFKRVLTTPGSIQLPAEAAPVTVACKAEGYRTTTATLDTSMDGWIIGNVIFGGIIGIVVDAARGAGEKYPPQLTVILEPERFATAQARDDWYDERRTAIEEKWRKAIAAAGSGCTAANQRDCDERVESAKKQRDAELAELERRRTQAVAAGM